MPSPPSLDSLPSGLLTSTNLNRLMAWIQFLADKPRVQLRQTSNQSIATGTGGEAVIWDTVDEDFNVTNTAQWAASPNPTRFTCAYPGKYDLDGGTSTATNAAGSRFAFWVVNGTPVPGGSVCVTPASGQPSVVAARSIRVFLSLGDYVELFNAQTSGGALNTAVATGQQSTATIAWAAYR